MEAILTKKIEQESLKDLMARYTQACNYPGEIDATAVTASLEAYLAALNVKRKVVRLPVGWSIDQFPDLQRYASDVLKEFAKSQSIWDARAARDAMDARAARDAMDARAARAARDAMDARDARDARDAMDARAARDARDAMAAMAARDARDAMDARAARDAMDAMDAMDARDGEHEALHRFLAWCMQGTGWSWWRFEMSWMATTHLGAVERDDAPLQRWTGPFFEAFTSGAWFLFWTEETLYWVAKPLVRVEQTPAGRRLHCPDGPAIKSDCEDLYFWHGVMIPDFIVTNPEKITVETVDGERNAEVRRAMLDNFPGGVEAYIKAAGAEVVDVGADDHPVRGLRGSRLIFREVPGDEPIVMIECRNSTPEPDGSIKLYHLRVDPNAYGGRAGNDVLAAMASTWRESDLKTLLYKKPEQYCPEIES